MLLEQGEIRRIKVGDTEILRRLYLAVRGPDWRTIPPQVEDLRVEAGDDSFRAVYAIRHRQDEFDFTWKVDIEGDAGGRLRFRAEGRAATSFLTNRVGLCVLHPPRECAGRPVRWRNPDGTEREGRFPDHVSPLEPFKDIAAFSHQLADGGWVDLEYAGETFEMEDQRNWTDGSFKTYSPPASLPKPRQAHPGWTVIQGVTLTLRPGEAPPVAADPGRAGAATGAAARAPALPGEAYLVLGGAAGLFLPALGFSRASHGHALGPKDLARLRALAPAHLRADFRLADPGLPEAVRLATAESAALGAPLEAALVVGKDVAAGLDAFVGAWRQAPGPVARFLVFHQDSDSTPETVFEAAAAVLKDLAPSAELALGSKNDFVLLNRGRPALERPVTASARLVYAMCPQVHAFDNRNLVESLDGQEWTLRTARSLFPRNPPVISTLSLKRSPFAASLKLPGPPPEGAWLKQADARQLSLFAAGWTLASIKRLAEQGALAGTYYQTTGPLGLMAGETCPPESRDFPGMDFRLEPSWVFPVYHVFADLAGFRGAELLTLRSTHPLRCEGLALQSGSRRMILLANLEESACPVRLGGVSGPIAIRRMDDKSARAAVEDAEGYRGVKGEALHPGPEGLLLELRPFEILRLEF